jgi:hypothetical protein
MAKRLLFLLQLHQKSVETVVPFQGVLTPLKTAVKSNHHMISVNW